MSEHENSDAHSLNDADSSHEVLEPSETTMIVNADMLRQAREGLGERDQAYLIIISGQHVGRPHKVGEGVITMGRSPQVDVQLNDVGVSRKHARIERRGDDVFVRDLKSANGTYVNGELVTHDHQLRDGDKITLGSTTILKFTYHDRLDVSFSNDMLHAAQHDGLTGAYNKKYLLEHLASEMSFALRHGTQLSMLMFDVDHFKQTNDTFGHLAGDYVLAQLSRLSTESVRDEDVFARYGGEEFAVVCRGIGLQQCAKLGNRLRIKIEQYPFEYKGRKIPVTISLGVSGIPAINASTPQDLIAAADAALYAAKKAGRNCLMIKGS